MDWLNFFRWVGYGTLATGAICTIGADISKNRKAARDTEISKKNEKLKDEKIDQLLTDSKENKELLRPFKDAAIKLFPNSIRKIKYKN